MTLIQWAGHDDTGTLTDGDAKYAGRRGEAIDVPDALVAAALTHGWELPGGAGAANPFTVGQSQVHTRQAVTVAESGDLSIYDAKAAQGTDPNKAALVTISAAGGVNTSTTVNGTAAINVLMFPTKPVADHVGEVKQAGARTFQGSYQGADATALVTLTVPLGVTFVLPAGWWYVTSDQSSGTGSIGGLNAIDYALG